MQQQFHYGGSLVVTANLRGEETWKYPITWGNASSRKNAGGFWRVIPMTHPVNSASKSIER